MYPFCDGLMFFSGVYSSYSTQFGPLKLDCFSLCCFFQVQENLLFFFFISGHSAHKVGRAETGTAVPVGQKVSQ